MDLTMSRRGDYAIRAAVYLAAAWDGPQLVTSGDICRTMEIPVSYAPHVLGYLMRAGLVTGKAGRGGGYRLVRDPEAVTLLEVVEAAEGSLAPKRCPLRGGPCRGEPGCPLHPSLSAGMDVFRRSLATTMLADVVRREPAARSSA